eukprot:scaffold75502_cov51-Phaeocystis_antarctica.AAC.3
MAAVDTEIPICDRNGHGHARAAADAGGHMATAMPGASMPVAGTAHATHRGWLALPSSAIHARPTFNRPMRGFLILTGWL